MQFEPDGPLFTTGCQTRITLREFTDRVQATHGDNKWGVEYRILIKTVHNAGADGSDAVNRAHGDNRLNFGVQKVVLHSFDGFFGRVNLDSRRELE